MTNSSPPRDDGSASISPVWGTVQGNLIGLAVLAGGLTLTASGLAIFLFVASSGSVPWIVLAVCAIAAVGEARPAQIGRNVDISIAALTVVFAAVVFGPLAAMVVGAATMASAPVPYMRCVIYASGRAVSGGVTGLAAGWAAGFATSPFLKAALAAVTAALLVEALDFVLAGATLSLRGVAMREFVAASSSVLVMTVPMLATVVAPLAYVYVEISAWAILLFLPPAFAAHRLFVLYQEQRELASSLAEANKRLERANISFARSLVAALDARDRYTAGHSAAVAIYARDTAARLGLATDTVTLAHFAGLLHDIGKVGLPPGIIEKPGKLTPDEWAEMQKHSEIGERILRNVDDYSDVATIVRSHHERIDGLGYPDGIQGDEIPLLSRVLAVADSYNAMTSGRPYRSAMNPAEAIRRMEEARGSQFDSCVLDAFLGVLRDADDLYKRGATADFALEAQAHDELRLPIPHAA